MNNLGFTILAEANQPQWRWMSRGAHPETQVLTICTMNCGIPDVELVLCEMLMSLLVQEPNVDMIKGTVKRDSKNEIKKQKGIMEVFFPS